MRAGLILAAVLLTSGFTGCLGLEDRWDDLKQDLEATPKFRQAQVLDVNQSFSVTGVLDPTTPPSSPEDLGASWSTTFEVPNGTKTLQVLFTVNFTDPPVAPPDPLPVPSQRGQVRVYMAPPGANGTDGNGTQDELYDADGQGGFDVKGPASGTWTVGFDQAIGEGAVSFRAEATVPFEARVQGNASALPGSG